MIKITDTDIHGWTAAIRGMRNPKNSWNMSDSYWTYIENPETGNRAPFEFTIGDKDLELMTTLAQAGDDHGKFLRFIVVTADITAPIYWWKEYDTYKVGTVANSCSTMHKIHDKEFTLDDFSYEHLNKWSRKALEFTINTLNVMRDNYLLTKDKADWYQLVEGLPSSYNQKRTIQTNYQVLKHQYFARKDHKLDDWHVFCDWAKSLPYFEQMCIGG